jgi:UDP-N-acetylmuramoylalanine--D-glutamate ligase
VIGWDAGAPENTGRLSELGVEVHLDASGDAVAAASSEARTLVKSPGVPQDAPIVQAARRRSIPVLGELELAWRLIPNEFVAVTGTNGKTTTTEWIAHIYREAALPVAVAGNVGTAASSLIGEISAEATVVCEASSFQLEDADAFSPEAAVLLNLSPDHLDRHRTFDEYVSAKLRIFANQGPGDVAVVPAHLGEIPGSARRIDFDSGLRPEVSLPGEHNLQNAMAAAAVCLARGVDPDAVAAGLRSFPGVAHRLERVAEIDGVRWVNDSKATNVASTLVALRAFPGGIRLIAGGRGKQQDFSPLAPLVAERCRAVYLIGEAAAELAIAFERTGVPLHEVGDLERAVARARAASVRGEVVLLSPACASYDQYRDFEARGEHFRALVEGR